LRFPELYRAYSAKDVPIFFVPSAFTVVTGKAHWDVLTRARAIENQAYIIAPAQCGDHPGGRKTHGHSRIVDPWGRVVAERPAGPGVVWADLSNDELNRVREEMPVLEHRRL
jgi:nitrilase